MPDSSEGVCALVLSAGHGSRYRAQAGDDKLLAPCFNDTDSPPVLAATLSALRGVAERTIVVVRADNRPLLNWLDAYATALQVEVFPVHSDGLGHSLAQAVARYPARRGWLIALGDMPYVKESTLAKVAGAIDETNLVMPTYAGHAGHPRGIGTAHWASLLALHGDTGAQALFADAEQILELAVDDSGIVQDVDVPDDRRSMPPSRAAG